jgi:hypothetical protein
MSFVKSCDSCSMCIDSTINERLAKVWSRIDGQSDSKVRAKSVNTETSPRIVMSAYAAKVFPVPTIWRA